MRCMFLVAGVLAVGGVARAEDAHPRSIWLECKAPAVWPARGTAPVRLTCRVEAGGPAFWQTVNPFPLGRSAELMDPFEAIPRTVDVVETRSRPRPPRPAPPRKATELADELMSPFEVYPTPAETLNPFDPPRDEAEARSAR